MTIKLSDGKKYNTTFDVSDTCFNGIDSKSEAEKSAILRILMESGVFIRLEGDHRISRVIMKSLVDIDMKDFKMIESGAGLVLCDAEGLAVCSLVIDESDEDEKDILFICSIHDTNCL